jgi:hypothetical protein
MLAIRPEWQKIEIAFPEKSVFSCLNELKLIEKLTAVYMVNLEFI